MFGFGKGKIGIVLDKHDYSPGEKIRGTLSLKVKKPVKANELRLEFIGERKSTTTHGGKARHRTDHIYKFEMPLDGENEYSGEKEYPFEISIPSDILDRGAKPEGALGSALQAAQFLAGSFNRISWYVKASLDIPGGMDINKKVQLNITR